MPAFPTWVWAVLAILAALAILGYLYALAMEARRETLLHDLRRQVITVRCTHLRNMLEFYSLQEDDPEVNVEIVNGDDINVDVLEDGPAQAA